MNETKHKIESILGSIRKKFLRFQDNSAQKNQIEMYRINTVFKKYFIHNQINSPSPSPSPRRMVNNTLDTQQALVLDRSKAFKYNISKRGLGEKQNRGKERIISAPWKCSRLKKYQSQSQLSGFHHDPK